jgi:hypothetical protein
VGQASRRNVCGSDPGPLPDDGLELPGHNSAIL